MSDKQNTIVVSLYPADLDALAALSERLFPGQPVRKTKTIRHLLHAALGASTPTERPEAAE